MPEVKMPKNRNNLKNTWLGLIFIFAFAPIACTDAGRQQPASNSTAANTKNADNSTEALKNAKSLPDNSTASNEEIYSPRAGHPNQIEQMPNAVPNAGENPSNDSQISPQSGNVPNLPTIRERETYSDDSGAVAESSSLPNTPVMHDLESVIDRWSDTEAASYGLRATLISLWRRNNPTVKYNPIGIDGLTGRIRDRPVFANCQRAKKLHRNMFHDDGIKTVGQLYDYLEPCGE